MKLSFFVLTAAVVSLGTACNPTPSASAPGAVSTVQVPSQETTSEPDPDDPTPTPAPSETPTPSASSESETPSINLRRDGGFGCRSFDPIKSQDACTTASDCAPSAHCHARSCIAAAKAPPKPPDVRCTMNLVCKSLDVGRCDCVDGVCALVSR